MKLFMKSDEMFAFETQWGVQVEPSTYTFFTALSRVLLAKISDLIVIEYNWNPLVCVCVCSFTPI